MSFDFVDPKDASPIPPRIGPSKAKYFHEFLDELTKNVHKGKVGVIPIEGGQSARGIKVSVGRVASSKSIKVQSWDDSDKNDPPTKVYVKLL